MKSDQTKKPLFVTDRFEVYHFDGRVGTTDERSGVYLAFYPEGEAPQPICVVTLSNQRSNGSRDIQWVDVNDDERRNGIATEVLVGLQDYVGPLTATAGTRAGAQLIKSLEGRLLGKRPFPFTDEAVKEFRAQGFTQAEIDQSAEQTNAFLDNILGSLE